MATHTGLRRNFFRDAAREALVWLEDARGKPNLQLADLPDLDAATLGALTPLIRPDVQIIPLEDKVCAGVPGEAETVELFALDDESLAVFNRFNGRQTISQISDDLSAALGWPATESFSRVRAHFLRLVQLRVCVPGNPTPPEAAHGRTPNS
jgi:hypothetical protein